VQAEVGCRLAHCVGSCRVLDKHHLVRGLSSQMTDDLSDVVTLTHEYYTHRKPIPKAAFAVLSFDSKCSLCALDQI